MCGILVARGIDRPFHHSMLNSLRRRGPDAIGFWTNRDLQMAHTRLSIIGLEENSNQPMENDTHVIAFNGEIYNFLELKQRVLHAGVRLHTSSDTEVLLHAWSLWGRAILRELHGFWAFSVFDKEKKTLTLCRDQLGIKPLYYWHSDETICAASLLRTVLDTVKQPIDLDYEAMSEYLRYQFTFGDKTFVRQIRKLLPGHCMEFNLADGSVTDEVYEDILHPADAGSIEYSPDLAAETARLIVECCHASTISDTSFTTFCSGGMDSSLITSITEPEIAYHCNYSDPDCNETFFARQVVAEKQTRLLVVNAQESFDIIQRLSSIIEDFDELTIGSVILPLDDLLAQVKRRYKVILTGTGGDELFSGYVRYQLALGECYQDSYRALFEKMRPLRTTAERFEFSHRKGNPSLYKFYDARVEATFHDNFEACRNGGGDLNAMLNFDRRFFLGGLLNIDDKMCGRHSLESRPSFLHQKLVRHVLRIAPTTLLRNNELKALLRSAASGYLPKSVLRRGDKMGFTTPIGTFINNSAHLVREQITSSRFAHLYDLSKAHFTAESKFSRETFGMLMLDLWLNRYATGSVGRDN